MKDSLFTVQVPSDIPKYRQIADSILHAITAGTLQKGDALPSINEVSKQCSLARETVVKAYSELKAKGVVSSRAGKGFYATTSHFEHKINVFVLFDVLLTPYKERLYDGIRAAMKDQANLDFCFHHHDPNIFCKLLSDAKDHYEYYVVMPVQDDAGRELLSTFDQDKLLILDIDVDFPGKRCSVIRQNHDEELVRALESGLVRIKRYEGMTLVLPEDRNHPDVIKPAFKRFCIKHGIAHRTIRKLRDHDLRRGQAYLVFEDADLVRLVKFGHTKVLQIGRDIGIISYNDTPFKEIIENGITVISVDFREMGRRTARQILQRKTVNVLQPTKMILRDSL